MLLEIFTDSLYSKPPSPSLDILWCKALFFKTCISVDFRTVFLKVIESHKFSTFFSFLVPKMSHFFEQLFHSNSNLNFSKLFFFSFPSLYEGDFPKNSFAGLLLSFYSFYRKHRLKQKAVMKFFSIKSEISLKQDSNTDASHVIFQHNSRR